MKSIITYFNEDADLRREENELIKKYLGSYASEVKVLRVFTRQRMGEKLKINFYRYNAKNKADISKFYGLLYDLLKNMDNTLPDKIKGKYNYVKLNKDISKEDYVKSKEKDYDDYCEYVKQEAENGPEILKQIAAEKVKSGKIYYPITFDLH